MGYKRLTEKCWGNLDPWECCGQDDYCTRGCHDEGGCTGGCIVPRNYKRLARYEDSDLSPEEVQEFAKAKAEGRLIVPPCKVGDKVYSQAGDPFTVCSININATSRRPKILIRYWASPQNALSELDDLDFWEDDIGKTVFLTPEAAEKALGEANL